MPDQHGFNHLGDNVRCIDCPEGGLIGRWPEHKRARHASSHGNRPKQGGGADLRRQRILLAAPPAVSNEEKRPSRWASKATAKGEPAKQVAIDVLRKAGEPLHAKEIAKRGLASGRCAGIKGKTPEATIRAMFAVGSKPGEPFARVDKGTYTVSDTASQPRRRRNGGRLLVRSQRRLARRQRRRRQRARREYSGRRRS
jgi:hypothetical protein